MTRLYDTRFALAFFAMVSFVVANTLLAHFARWVTFLGGDVEDVGWIIGVGSVVSLFFRPWLGHWINRFGACVTWGLGLALFAIGAMGNLALDGLGPAIYILRSATFLGAAFVFASSMTFVTQLAPLARRTEAIGVLGAAGFVGMLTGPLTGDLILSEATRSRGEFTFVFLLAGGTTALAGILLAIIGWMARPSRAAKPPSRADRGSGLLSFVRDCRAHWPGTVLFVNFVFGACMTVPFGFLADYIDTVPRTVDGPSAVGVFFLGYGGWALPLRILTRRIPDRLGRRRFLILGLVFEGAGMLAFLFTDPASPWSLLLPGVICGTGHTFIFPTMTSLALDRFPHEVRGSGTALTLMAMDAGTIGLAPVLGMVAAQRGYEDVFVWVGTLCFLAAVIYTAVSVPVWRARMKANSIDASEVKAR